MLKCGGTVPSELANYTPNPRVVCGGVAFGCLDIHNPIPDVCWLYFWCSQMRVYLLINHRRGGEPN